MNSVKHDTGRNYLLSVVLKTRSGLIEVWVTTTAAAVSHLYQWEEKCNFLVTGPENNTAFR